MRWAGHVVRVGGTRCVDSVLVGTSEGKTPFGRPRYRWKDSIKMYLHEVGWGEAWTGLI